jgi:hypothetical protein
MTDLNPFVSIALGIVGVVGALVSILAWCPSGGSLASWVRTFVAALCILAIFGSIALLILRPVMLKRYLGALVRRAAEYEITIYQSPEAFPPGSLYRYFLPMQEGGQQVPTINRSVRRLLRHGWHYAQVSRLDSFKVISVTLEGDGADVATTERWYLPLLDKYGEEVTSVGGHHRDPWLPSSSGTKPVHYFLVRRGNQWLIKQTSDVYVKYD